MLIDRVWLERYPNKASWMVAVVPLNQSCPLVPWGKKIGFCVCPIHWCSKLSNPFVSSLAAPPHWSLQSCCSMFHLESKSPTPWGAIFLRLFPTGSHTAHFTRHNISSAYSWLPRSSPTAPHHEGSSWGRLFVAAVHNMALWSESIFQWGKSLISLFCMSNGEKEIRTKAGRQLQPVTEMSPVGARLSFSLLSLKLFAGTHFSWNCCDFLKRCIFDLAEWAHLPNEEAVLHLSWAQSLPGEN